MEIEVKSQSENEIVFIVRDAEVPFINAIRRVAMVNVPKIAIEDVNIINNKIKRIIIRCLFFIF